jgi:hypothetical protein
LDDPEHRLFLKKKWLDGGARQGSLACQLMPEILKQKLAVGFDPKSINQPMLLALGITARLQLN